MRCCCDRDAVTLLRHRAQCAPNETADTFTIKYNQTNTHDAHTHTQNKMYQRILRSEAGGGGVPNENDGSPGAGRKVSERGVAVKQGSAELEGECISRVYSSSEEPLTDFAWAAAASKSRLHYIAITSQSALQNADDDDDDGDKNPSNINHNCFGF